MSRCIRRVWLVYRGGTRSGVHYGRCWLGLKQAGEVENGVLVGGHLVRKPLEGGWRSTCAAPVRCGMCSERVSGGGSLSKRGRAVGNCAIRLSAPNAMEDRAICVGQEQSHPSWRLAGFF